MSPVDDTASTGDPAAPDTPHRSRRWFLAGGAAAVVGGGAGVGAALLRPESHPTPRPAPAPLVAAVTAERALLALAARAARQEPSLHAEAAVLTADHTAHLRALESALAGYDPVRPVATASPAPSPAPSDAGSGGGAGSGAGSRAALRAAERDAATTAARHAQQLTGPVATVLASISACESSHAELLA